MRLVHTFLLSILAFVLSSCDDKCIYVSPSGDDTAKGTSSAPLASLRKAIEIVEPGQTIVLRGGTYRIAMTECMDTVSHYVTAFVLDKDGRADAPITIRSAKGEKAIIDLSDIKPRGRRVMGFRMAGAHWILDDFDIVGIQVTITRHSQSENIGIYGASYCVVSRLRIHDGMGIGVYAKEGHNNLIVNCDAYNNYDSVSENGKGGNSDGFGFHFNTPNDTCNVIRGCRAWCNSDDGIDLINNFSPVVVDSCWAFWNGYDKDHLKRADGTGVKAGGYGLHKKEPFDVPRNIITNCIAWHNKNKGIYANHHLGGNTWIGNIAYENPLNFSMVNQKSFDENYDVPGYGHTLKDNISFKSREDGELVMVDMDRCLLTGNRFGSADGLSEDSFVSLDGNEMLRPRKADGSLPEIDFMKLKQ